MIKRLVKSKAFWTGLASVGTGIGAIVAGNLQEGIILVIGGASTIFLRDAIAKNGKSN